MSTTKRVPRTFKKQTKTLAGVHCRLRQAVKTAGDVSDLVKAGKRFDRESKKVAPTVRALHYSQTLAEELVAVLRSSGVKFASPKQAPSQIAASIYAGWLEVFRESGSEKMDPVDWLFVVWLACQGVDHAVRTSAGAPDVARRIINQRAGT